MEERERKPACPICSETLYWDKHQRFWKCPVCKTEVWPDEKKLEEIEKAKREKEKSRNMWEQLKWAVGNKSSGDILPTGPPAPGSGSRTKSRKKPVKKDIKPLEPWKLA